MTWIENFILHPVNSDDDDDLLNCLSVTVRRQDFKRLKVSAEINARAFSLVYRYR